MTKVISMHVRNRKLALMEGVAAGVLFGTASIFIKFLQDSDVFFIVFWRLIFACLALLTILLVFRRSLNVDLLKKNVKEILLLSFFISLHFVFFVSAVKDTTILNATVLVNIAPIFSVIVSGFVFKLKPSRMATLGLAISFIGACVIAYTDATAAGDRSRVGSPSLKGDLEAVLAALVESFYLNYGRRIRNQMNILSIMLPIYAFAAIIVGIFSIPSANTAFLSLNQIGSVLPLLGLGLLPTAVAHTLYFSSLSDLKSFETATMALLEPIGATILGIAFFQEVPAPVFALGAVLVLAGILFVVKKKD